MKRFQRVISILLLLAGALLVTTGQGVGIQSAASTTARVNVVKVADGINPVIARFITEEIERTNRERMRAFILELDTPGGLDTAMRDIIQAILNSEAPVVVYVSPKGARAASAGALITLAADFAVMAPGTNIGAATPVALGGGGGEQDQAMMEKVLQDAVAYARSLADQRGRNPEWAERIIREGLSSPAREALEQQVIDFIAEDEADLLAQLDGRRYLRAGQERILDTQGVEILRAEMNWRQQILTAISNPNVAYLLLMLGFLGIFFELSNPGAIVPGAIGAIALLLAFFGLQTLPVNYVGVLLLLLALVLFILEIYVSSYGMLTVGGILSMSLGSLMLIDSADPYVQISRAVIFATVLVSTSFFVIVIYYVTRAQRRPAFSGSEGMVGERGKAVSSISPEGRVFVHGELWTAHSDDLIEEGEIVEVVAMIPGMKLEVRKVKGNKQH